MEKPSWRIQGEHAFNFALTRDLSFVLVVPGGFEFVLAGISISDPDALDDGGLITAKLTTTRGWCNYHISFLHDTSCISRHVPLCRWSLPTSPPSMLLNGATGIRDALSVTFRATFLNMINIIGQVLASHPLTLIRHKYTSLYWLLIRCFSCVLHQYLIQGKML